MDECCLDSVQVRLIASPSVAGPLRNPRETGRLLFRAVQILVEAANGVTSDRGNHVRVGLQERSRRTPSAKSGEGLDVGTGTKMGDRPRMSKIVEADPRKVRRDQGSLEYPVRCRIRER